MRILIIQSAFLGDVILITPMLRELKIAIPEAEIDVLVRKGNESLLSNNPHLSKLFIWDKKRKFASLFENLFAIRNRKYDEVICVQRYFNAGFLATFSKGKKLSGFSQNPWSFMFHNKMKHELHGGKHEVDRNLALIQHLIGEAQNRRPELFPTSADYDKVAQYQKGDYYCLAPASVWFTKQLPEEQWVKLIGLLGENKTIYLLGAPGDKTLCERIQNEAKNPKVVNLCGQLSLLQSAALMKNARRCYVNDSGPMHLASSMNAPTTVFFCSTIPNFGFGPLSGDSQIIEIQQKLDCRPCGSHGHKSCPKGHFDCGNKILISDVGR
jgi:ADP-heptose:LPS heptosyltransferase